MPRRRREGHSRCTLGVLATLGSYTAAQQAHMNGKMLVLTSFTKDQVTFMNTLSRSNRTSAIEIISSDPHISSGPELEDTQQVLSIPEEPPATLPAKQVPKEKVASPLPEAAIVTLVNSTDPKRSKHLEEKAVEKEDTSPLHPPLLAVFSAVGASLGYLVLIILRCIGLLREFSPKKPMRELIRRPAGADLEDRPTFRSTFPGRRARRAGRLFCPPRAGLCGDGCGSECSQAQVHIEVVSADKRESQAHLDQ